MAATADGPQRETYWAVPTSAGDIPEWKQLDVSDLPYGLSGGTVIITGPNAIIVGGETAEGPVTTSLRANTAPQSPFFQLGLVGATVPGLKIDGEIGQQLGYLNAAGAGTRRVRDPVAHRLGVRSQGAGTGPSFGAVLRRRPEPREPRARSAGEVALARGWRTVADGQAGTLPGVHAAGRR